MLRRKRSSFEDVREGKKKNSRYAPHSSTNFVVIFFFFFFFADGNIDELILF